MINLIDIMEIEMFKTGDVVILKSGGPNMTVVSISEDDALVDCTWMSDSEVYAGDFLPATIEHTETLTIDP